jgi:hypothetical protein
LFATDVDQFGVKYIKVKAMKEIISVDSTSK